MIFLLYFQDDDHSYVVGTAFQGIQKPLETSGKKLFRKLYGEFTWGDIMLKF